MGTNKIISVVFSLLICIASGAQVVKSEKTYLRISNIPEKEVIRTVDQVAPVIKIVSPVPDSAGNYVSASAEFSYIGKVTDENEVGSLVINGELRELSPAGVFAGRMVLIPGRNELAITAIDTSDNLSEYKLDVFYYPPVLSLHDKVEKEAVYYALIIG